MQYRHVFIIFFLCWTLLVFHVHGIPSCVTFEFVWHFYIFKAHVPIRTIISPCFPGMHCGDYSTIFWVTGFHEPSMTCHQTRKNFLSLSGIIRSAFLNHLQYNRSKHRWLRKTASGWLVIAKPDIWTGVIIWVILSKHNVRDHTIFPLCVEQ